MTDPSHSSAFPPPPGRVANFENPESIAHEVIEISISCSCVATFFVLLRLYGRLFIVRSPGLDDVCIVIGLILSWAVCILSIANIRYGYGNHLWDLYVPDVIMFLKVDLGAQNVYFMGTCFVKVSIILMYLRLNPEKVFRYLAWLIIAFDVTYSSISVLVVTVGCRPIAGSWDITIPSVCVDKKAYYFAQAVFNIVSDFCTLALPVRMCWRLQMHRRQRILLVLLFAVGSFACIVSIVRLVTMIPTLKDNDFTWFKVQVAAWCEVEINVGIVCACLPCLRPILSHHSPRMLDSLPVSGDIGENPKANTGYNLRSFSKERWNKKPRLDGWGASVEYRANVTEGADNDGSESAKGILKDHGERGVVRTTEYGVEYDSYDDHA